MKEYPTPPQAQRLLSGINIRIPGGRELIATDVNLPRRLRA
jgi:hypothetical protein